MIEVQSAALLETRCECIFRHVERFLRATNTSEETWSLTVVEIWVLIPERIRAEGVFKITGEICKQQAANGLKIRRWGSADVSATPSIDVEDVLVLALPEPYRSDCERDLALRRGRMSAPRVRGNALSLSSAGEAVSHVGDALKNLAQALANDGEINGRDSVATLTAARNSLLDAQADLSGVLAMVEGALGQAPAAPMQAVRRVK